MASSSNQGRGKGRGRNFSKEGKGRGRAEMWCYCRTTYMPMSYLYGNRIQGPITQLVISLRKEIHLTPYEDINWNKQRNNCCKDDFYYPHSFLQDALWDSLHYLTEPFLRYWPFSKLRDISLNRVVELMRYESEETRYMTIGCVEKSLQMMCWWAENPNGDEFKYHLARVPDYLWIAEDGMTMHSFGSQVWDCSLATQAILSSNMAEEYGDCLQKAHFYLRESQVRENPSGDFTKMCRQFTKGSWTFSDQDQGWTVSDCTAEALKCLLLLSQMPKEIAGEKADVVRLYEAVNVLLYMQHHEKVLVIADDYKTLFVVNGKWPRHAVLVPPVVDNQVALVEIY
ncbi:squalene cyclase [Artemisia annua]|uniref:Squalene cyclase n=1 Tax=Artemisia annua TaxID=35608 RepID=A0A2U1Q403_ARTAN|nr:squalene cyclase [Artemisia annua]